MLFYTYLLVLKSRPTLFLPINNKTKLLVNYLLFIITVNTIMFLLFYFYWKFLIFYKTFNDVYVIIVNSYSMIFSLICLFEFDKKYEKMDLNMVSFIYLFLFWLLDMKKTEKLQQLWNYLFRNLKYSAIHLYRQSIYQHFSISTGFQIFLHYLH